MQWHFLHGLQALLIAPLVGIALSAAANDSRLAAAAQIGDRATVARLLRDGAGVDVPTADGTTALHWAIYRDDAELAALLIDAGADANAVNRNGATPLTLACVNASPALVERLLDAGADPNLAPAGEPPLLSCARTGRVGAVRALRARGAAVDATDRWRGQTPLMWAAAENHVAIMNVLLEGGADVNAASNGTFTALLFAVRQDARDATRLLIAAGADVNAIAPSGHSVLRLAITNRHYRAAAMLLEAGADPNARDARGNTALHALVTSRAPRRQPGPQRLGIDGDSTQRDGLELMRMLLSRGATPNARTEPEPRLSDERVSQAGLKPVIDNLVNMGGATPYLLAAQAADVEAMRVLAAHGADPRLATFANNTALTLAAGVVFTEGVQLSRPEHDVLAAVTLALAAGNDINAANAHGQTALHGAVYRAADRVIRHLVDAGARMDLVDELGRTPLDLAEQGFNQVASLIRRERASALLSELGAASGEPVPRYITR